MKILVTGATGFIGQNLISLLLKKNYEIHCIVRLNSDTSKLEKNVQIFQYDESIDSLIKYFQEQQFDGVIHLASHTKDNELDFGTELLEACKIQELFGSIMKMKNIIFMQQQNIILKLQI